MTCCSKIFQKLGFEKAKPLGELVLFFCLCQKFFSRVNLQVNYRIKAIKLANEKKCLFTVHIVHNESKFEKSRLNRNFHR